MSPQRKKKTLNATVSQPETKETASREAKSGNVIDLLDVCYQCGQCSGGCPVARVTPEYNIRRIIKAARDGRIQPDDKSIWLCSTCYTCYERCPQDVKPIKIIQHMTNIASQKGCIPIPVKEGNRNILTTGRILEVTISTQQKRKALGLPELQTDVSRDFRRIAELTGMEKLLR